VHDALIRVLAEYGLAARRLSSEAKHESAPFLCFQRRMPGDVLSGEAKICGSAQRRRAGAILQHGSVLLARSSWAPELPGILEVGGRSLDPNQLAIQWGRQLAAALQVSLSPGEFSQAERGFAASLAREKYATAGWNRRR
jgi:lipoate-protein ligase A